MGDSITFRKDETDPLYAARQVRAWSFPRLLPSRFLRKQDDRRLSMTDSISTVLSRSSSSLIDGIRTKSTSLHGSLFLVAANSACETVETVWKQVLLTAADMHHQHPIPPDARTCPRSADEFVRSLLPVLRVLNLNQVLPDTSSL